MIKVTTEDEDDVEKRSSRELAAARMGAVA